MVAGVSAPLWCGAKQPGCWQRKQVHNRSHDLFLSTQKKKKGASVSAALHGAGSAWSLVQNIPVDLFWLSSKEWSGSFENEKKKKRFFLMCV